MWLAGDLKSFRSKEETGGCRVPAESLAGKIALTSSCSTARGRPLGVQRCQVSRHPYFLGPGVPASRRVNYYGEARVSPGDSYYIECGRRKLGWEVTSKLPLPDPVEPAQIPRGWDGPRGCVSTLPFYSGTLGCLGEELRPMLAEPERRVVQGALGSQAKGPRDGWPSEPAQESPALNAVPTHLVREIVARTAGQGELGGLAILGGSSGTRLVCHVSGREVS